jgi:hypothetical protein
MLQGFRDAIQAILYLIGVVIGVAFALGALLFLVVLLHLCVAAIMI